MKRFTLIPLCVLLALLSGCGGDPVADKQISTLNKALEDLQQEKVDLEVQLEPLQTELSQLKLDLEEAQKKAQKTVTDEDVATLQGRAEKAESQLQAMQAAHANDLAMMEKAYQARLQDIGRKQPSIELGLRTYKNVTFRQFTTTGLVLDHEGGMLNIAYDKLPRDLKERYLYEPQAMELLPTSGE